VSAFGAALLAVPQGERDAWVDRTLGIGDLLPDGDELPRGSAPNLPCRVDALLRALDLARVDESDVFVDVGSGMGRALLVAHLATGASAIGVEIQAHLVAASRALIAHRGDARISIVHGDATTAALPIGSVYFLYCPFSGAPLERLLDTLEPIARTSAIRICAVDLALPSRAWLVAIPSDAPDVVVVESTFAGPA
jgi:hypothetical protein